MKAEPMFNVRYARGGEQIEFVQKKCGFNEGGNERTTIHLLKISNSC